jgi:hypothetical protein
VDLGQCFRDLRLAGDALRLDPLQAFERVSREVVVLLVAPASVSAFTFALQISTFRSPACYLKLAVLVIGVLKVSLVTQPVFGISGERAKVVEHLSLRELRGDGRGVAGPSGLAHRPTDVVPAAGVATCVQRVTAPGTERHALEQIVFGRRRSATLASLDGDWVHAS